MKAKAWFIIATVLNIAISSFAVYDVYDSSNEKNVQIKELKADNVKFAKEWSKQQDQYNTLLLDGFTQKQADEFVANGCLEYYVGVVK